MHVQNEEEINRVLLPSHKRVSNKHGSRQRGCKHLNFSRVLAASLTAAVSDPLFRGLSGHAALLLLLLLVIHVVHS